MSPQKYPNESYTDTEWSRIDSEFSRLAKKNITYLDHAGSALYSERQIRDSCSRLEGELYCNPHTNELTERKLDEVREKVLQFFNTNSSKYEIIFTRGATDSLKIVAETFDFQTAGHFLYLRNSHNSVVGLRSIVKTNNVSVMEVDALLEISSAKHKSVPIYSLSNSLFVFPAQCNFNGYKYPLDVIDKFHISDIPTDLQKKSKNWFVCVDAANYVSTSYLDLSKYNPDFVVLSFYKIFGYPTGLGALLVSNRGQQVLKKVYHGGGSVEFALSNIEYHRYKEKFNERFEDGTMPFLSIISLLSGFETLKRLIPPENGLKTMERISRHTFYLAKYFYEQLKLLKYPNGQPLVKFFNQSEFSLEEQKIQGGIVTFQVLRFHGEPVGYKEIEGLAEMNSIFLRVGCFCNPGACQTNLTISSNKIMALSLSGIFCNGALDVIDGMALGFVRVSFGFVSKKENVDTFLRVLQEWFLEKLFIPPMLTMNFEIVQMRVYPLKGAGPMILSNACKLKKNLFVFEGQWAISNGFGSLVKTSTNEALCSIRVLINERKGTIRLIYPQSDPLDIYITASSDYKCGEIKKGKNLEMSIDCGDKAAHWLSKVLGEKVRLVQLCNQNENSSKIVTVTPYTPKTGTVESIMRVVNVARLLDSLNEYGIEATEEEMEECIQIYRPHYLIYGSGPMEKGSSLRIHDRVFQVVGRCLETWTSPSNLDSSKIMQTWIRYESLWNYAANVKLQTS